MSNKLRSKKLIITCGIIGLALMTGLVGCRATEPAVETTVAPIEVVKPTEAVVDIETEAEKLVGEALVIDETLYDNSISEEEIAKQESEAQLVDQYVTVDVNTEQLVDLSGYEDQVETVAQHILSQDELHEVHLELLDDTITLYTLGDITYDDAKYMINTDCDMYSIADEIRAEYLAKLDSITPQVKETQAPVVQKPVEQKPTVQETQAQNPVEQPVVQQPQQTGEVYKGQSIDIYTSRGYTVEEAKQRIDEYLAPEVLDTIKGVTTEDDVKGWN